MGTNGLPFSFVGSDQNIVSDYKILYTQIFFPKVNMLFKYKVSLGIFEKSG